MHSIAIINSILLSNANQLLQTRNQVLLLKQKFGNCPLKSTKIKGNDITLISLELFHPLFAILILASV